MSTEQLAIIVPGVVAVSIAALNVVWQTRITQKSLDHQAQVNRETLSHQTKLAVQGRVAATYEDMLEMVGWSMEVVEATKPIMTIGDPPEPPPQPETEWLRKVQARLGAHGSREVKDALERWAKERHQFFNDAWYLDEMQNDRTSGSIKDTYGVTLSGQWEKVEERRSTLRRLVHELEDATSAELRA